MSKRFLINCIDYRYDNLVTQYYNSIGYTVVDIINHPTTVLFYFV